jgi:hypothetical protein
MAVDLTQSLAWKSATEDATTMLGELQPNIFEGHAATPYVGITKSGHAKLGISANWVPADRSFRASMKAQTTRQKLHDPPFPAWEAPYRGNIHTVVLVCGANDVGAEARRDEVLVLLQDTVGCSATLPTRPCATDPTQQRSACCLWPSALTSATSSSSPKASGRTIPVSRGPNRSPGRRLGPHDRRGLARRQLMVEWAGTRLKP